MTPNEIQGWARRISDNPHNHGTAERVFADECLRLRAELEALTNKYQSRWAENRAAETALEHGTRVHQEVEAKYGRDWHDARKAWAKDLKVVAMTHDEITVEVPEREAWANALTGIGSLTNAPVPKGRPLVPSWCCSDRSCPERKPIFQCQTPTCYTCGKPMAKFATQLTPDRDDDDLVMFEKPQPITGLAEMLDNLKARIASAARLPTLLLDSEPRGMKQTWQDFAQDCVDYRSRYAEREMWGPSPIAGLVKEAFRRGHDESDAQLRARITASMLPSTDAQLRARITASMLPSTVEGIRSKILMCVHVAECTIQEWPGRVLIECTLRDLTHENVKQVDAIVREIVPAGLDWRLDCIQQKQLAGSVQLSTRT